MGHKNNTYGLDPGSTIYPRQTAAKEAPGSEDIAKGENPFEC